MKKIKVLLFCIFTLVVFGGGFLIGQIYTLHRQAQNSCPIKKSQHVVVMAGNTFLPHTVSAKRCDVLTFLNRDQIVHTVAFGNHDHHITYNDFEEEDFLPGEIMNITLSKTGTYPFHDHQNESMRGQIVIQK